MKRYVSLSMFLLFLISALFAGEFTYLRDMKRGQTPYEYAEGEHMKLTFDDHATRPSPNYARERARAIAFGKSLNKKLVAKADASESCRPLGQKMQKLETALGKIKSNSNMGDADWDIKTSLSDADSFLRIMAEKASGERRTQASAGRSAARKGYKASMRFRDKVVIKNAKQLLQVYKWLLQDAGC